MQSKILTTVTRFRAMLMGAALSVCLFSVAAGHFVSAADTPKTTMVALTVSETPPNHEHPSTGSFAPVVKRVAQSVVKVTVVGKARSLPMQFNGGNEDLLRRFFGDQFGGTGPMRAPRERGLGSGVIVNKDGYILTNNHVVESAESIRVTLNDGREFTAKVIGRDPNTDVAVLKIEAKDLPYMTIADSDKAEVGDLCLAIGNPFGIGQTVTMGIVSAVGRSTPELGEMGTDYQDFIQTDAAINPGNSGGALVDADGRLIGINTAILSRSGGNQGIGFAVPINLARNVMENLIEHGRVIRGFIGVGLQDVDSSLVEQFKLSNNQGALVAEVVPHGPAENAGIKSGDVIVEFNGKAVPDYRHLKLQVAQVAPGSKVSVKLIRDGQPKTLWVTVKERGAAEGEKSEGSVETPDSSDDSLSGVQVSDLDAQTRRQAGIPENVTGALIVKVDPDSASYEAGLRAGDVIQEMNKKTVATADDAVRLSTHVKDRVALLKIWSKGHSHYLVVDESNKN